jgi:hypothetical protein
VGVALSCGVEVILRRRLSPRLLKLSRLSVTGFGLGRSERQTLRLPQHTLAGIPPKRSLVICIPPEARGSLLRDCNHLWRVGHPTERQGRIKAPFAGTIYSTSFLKPLLFEHWREAHSTKCVDGVFCELRVYEALRSSRGHVASPAGRKRPSGAYTLVWSMTLPRLCRPSM